MDLGFLARVASLYASGMRYDHWSRQKMAAMAKSEIDKARSFAIANSKFYQKHHKGLENAPLSELPPVTKQMIMSNFNEFVTDNEIDKKDIQKYLQQHDNSELFLNKYKVLTTSGSTGHPGMFLYNKREWANIATTFALTFLWAGVIVNPFFKKKRVLIASTSPWHISTQLGLTMEEMKMPGHLVPANQPLRNIVKTLNEYQPQEVIAYASMAAILANEQLEGRLSINPEKIFTTSEVLTDEMCKKIHQVWKDIHPINKYALTEGGCIGGQCETGNMHFLEQNAYFEVVDENYKPVPPGQYGQKLLMTSFIHRTQPMIRYEISDSIKLANKPCECGRPHTTIADIQGRAEQIIKLPGKKMAQVQILPINFHHIMDSQPIQFWQIIQKKTNNLDILVTHPSSDFSKEKIIRNIKKNLQTMEVEIPKIYIRQVKEIPKEKSGKLPYIKVE